MVKTLIILFGAPGSGKGYLADKIEESILKEGLVTKEEIRHISTGDLLRAEIASGSELGQELAQIINEGKLVSDTLVNELIEKALQGEETVKFIDGYPRTLEQLKAFAEMLDDKGDAIFAIKRDTPVSVILERVSKRRVCKDCKATLSTDFETCPKCGGELIVRKDDAVIEKRLEEYEAHTSYLWDHLEDLSDFSRVLGVDDDSAEFATELVEYLF